MTIFCSCIFIAVITFWYNLLHTFQSALGITLIWASTHSAAQENKPILLPLGLEWQMQVNALPKDIMFN